jgi:thiamine biosynthesis lipoprotein
MSHAPGVYSVPKELVEILSIYQKFFILTNGSLNPLVGNTLSDLGYDKDYSLSKKDEVRITSNFLDTVTILDVNKIEIKEKVLIDIGAIGKGYWVDKVREILVRNNITNYIVNGSGDIYVHTPGLAETSKVGLENSSGEIFQTLEMKIGSLCGSGTNKRNWSTNASENLHHIIDANTSKPTENIESAWVKSVSLSRSTTLCDGLAKAVFFVDVDVLRKLAKEQLGIEFEYYIIFTNKKTLVSKNFFS